MAKYTIEDVEILRQKSGISYEEAVNLLEYHNGSLARALVDLEKNGRIKSAASAGLKDGRGIFNFLYRLRLKAKKGDVTVINLSALFLLVVLATAPHICVIGLIVSLVLGYRISIERNSPDFASDNLESMVKNAKGNVQQSVSEFARQFAQNDGATQQETAAQPRTQSAPSGTRPVNVQFSDGGSVDVRDDGDGYHEADIR